jgi:MFS family permease
MMGVDTFVTAGFSVAMPFLALYLHNERGIPMSAVGVLFLVGGLCSAGTNMVGGMLSDRFGRRRLLLLISTVSILAYAWLAVMVGFSMPVWLICIAYVAARGIVGTVNPTVSAIVADLSPRERLPETFALVRIGGNVGFALAPALGGYLMGHISYGWLLGLSGVAYAITTLLVLLFLRESYHGSHEKIDFRSTIAVGQDRRFLVFSALCLLLFASMAQMGSTLSIFAVNRIGFSTAQYGLLLTTNGIVVVALQYFAARLSGRMSRYKGLALGSLFYAAGYLSLGWATNFNLAVGSLVIISLGEVTFAPLSSAVVAESAPEDKRGRYMGFFGLSSTLGFSVAPLLGGILLDIFPTQPPLLWGTIALGGVIAAIGFYRWGKMSNPNQKAKTVPTGIKY